jgi:hypothetical protein
VRLSASEVDALVESVRSEIQSAGHRVTDRISQLVDEGAASIPDMIQRGLTREQAVQCVVDAVIRISK